MIIHACITFLWNTVRMMRCTFNVGTYIVHPHARKNA